VFSPITVEAETGKSNKINLDRRQLLITEHEYMSTYEWPCMCIALIMKYTKIMLSVHLFNNIISLLII
jgi:hypothetical protein